MPLTEGTKLGPYEILAPIGAGGISEVYKAKDTSLDRGVATKALPEVSVENKGRLPRFEREAHLQLRLGYDQVGCHATETGSTQNRFEVSPVPLIAEATDRRISTVGVRMLFCGPCRLYI